MERYESLGLVGEGSYGTVLKCRHRESGRLVAIKKFVDSDDDKTVKKIALREIKLLRQLRHDNLVNLLEVWKRRRRWYLVFEFVERTLLDDLEQNPTGLDLNTSRQILFQILRAAAFCHQQNIIHRDIKPENILISQCGVVKMCDFGFARTMTSPAEGGFTPTTAVDVWAFGCLLLEMLTGIPAFLESDFQNILAESHWISAFLQSHPPPWTWLRVSPDGSRKTRPVFRTARTSSVHSGLFPHPIFGRVECKDPERPQRKLYPSQNNQNPKTRKERRG
ncbi:hypothetical protein F7725_005001 [Dissostichus mawsoni]|uniref:Cyclin-dependent kinase-like 2 n=1 Tax=Dissostichus mawsoni TaxID=36200 RepID=A0A7J5XLS8_DISMA|nr:hypothetical protein F7725_005001 [Dissostichus mawsoni]